VTWSYDMSKEGEEASFHGDPLVAGDLVLVGTDGGGVPNASGHLFAFAWKTGELRWKYRADKGVATDILLSGSKVYAVSSGDRLDCFNLKDGRLLWSYPATQRKENAPTAQAQTEHVGPASLSPVLVGKRVFFATAEGRVYAVNAASGRLLWERDLASPITTDLASLGDALYVGTSAGRLCRLVQKSGAVAAVIDAPQRPFGKPVIAGSSLVVLLTEAAECCDSLAAFDLSLKKLIWRQSATGSPGISDSQGGAAGSEVHPRWTTIRPRLWDGLVLAGNDQGVLAAVRPSDGSWAWRRQFRGRIRGIGADADGRLYVGTVEGALFAFQP
jgi:outer membrane protein assembly factor BamB